MNYNRACHNTPFRQHHHPKVKFYIFTALSQSKHNKCHCTIPRRSLPKAPNPLPWFPISLCGSVWGPAEKPPPGVRSGVIYHSRLCRELTFAQAFYSTIVIESPCLFEDTNRYNYVRTPQLYITRLTEKDNQWVIIVDQLNKRWTPHWLYGQLERWQTINKYLSGQNLKNKLVW